MPNLLLLADDAVRIAATGYRSGDLDDTDVSNYGFGQSYTRVDRRQKQQPFSNNWRGLNQVGGFFGGVPQITFASARAQRGEILPTLIDNSIGIVSYPFLKPAMAPFMRMALAGTALTPAAPFVAAIGAAYAAYQLGSYAATGVRYVNQWGYKLRHIEQGGGYEDTETAYALRGRAISEMSSALSYSRRWLGNEALFLR